MNKNNWYGQVTNENISNVAQMILEKLEGRKYTWTESYEYAGFIPRTRVHQELENGTNGSPLSIWKSEELNHSGANFCDSYGVWRISPGFYVVINYNSITIELQTPAQRKAYWQITLE